MKPKFKLHSLLTCGSTLLAAILFTQSALAADGTWIQVSNGSWSGTGNWSGGIVADGATFTANLTPNLNGNRTVTIDTTSRTLGIVNMGDADFLHNQTIAATGGATLTFDNGGSTAQLNTLSTSGPTNALNATLPVFLNDSLAIANASAKPLNLQGTISSSAVGTKTISNVGAGGGLVTLSGVISNGTGTVTILQNSATSPMTISGNANTYTGGNTSSAGTLTISGSAPNTAGGGGPTAINAGGTIVFATTNSLYANTAADWTPANITVASGGTLAVRTSGFSAADIDFLLASPQLGASTASTGLKPGSILGFDTTGGNFTYGNVLADLSGGNALNVSKIGVNTLTLDQTNIYTGTTTAVGGVLLPTTPASLPGYNVSGKVIFNGGTIAVSDVGGAGWATTDVNALLSNATKTSGALGIDTSAGDLTQWAAFTAANFGSLGLTKVGSNTLTLDQVNTYTGPTLVSGGTLKLANADAISSSSGLVVSGGSVVVDTTVALNALSFDVAAASSVSGGTLSFSGGSINQYYNNFDATITSQITGNPTINVNRGPLGNTYQGLIFAPDSGTQALGVVNLPADLGGTADKAGITLGGSTTGNTLTSIGYANSAWPYATVNKTGTSTWTTGNINTGTVIINSSGGTLIVNGTVNAAYNGFTYTAGTLTGNVSLRRSDRRGNHDFLSGFKVAPGDSGVGTITILDGTGGTPTAAQQYTIFRAGSIYQWEVGPSSQDTVHIAAGKMQLDGFTLKILDAGGTPANGAVQLPVFTYAAGVTTRTLSLGSVVFDTSALDGSWTIGTLALTDDGAGTIYLTGLSKTVIGTAYDTWATGSEPFDGDANGDGVKDGLAFLLGATNPSQNALNKLPTSTESGGGLVLEFDCLPTAARGTAVLNLQFSNDLGISDPWTSAEVPGVAGTTDVGSVHFVATGTSPIHVVATISSSEAAAGKLFARLNGEQ